MISLELLRFYGLWQIGVSLFAFAGLLSIWYHLGQKQQDYGQVFLAFSLLFWAFSGVVDLVQYASELSEHSPYDAWRSIFSLCNSLFILLALPWFRYIPEFISPLIKSKFWPIIIGLPFLIALVPSVVVLCRDSVQNEVYTGDIIIQLDVVYAFITLLFLSSVLYYSFVQRRLSALSYLTVLAIGITVLAQVLKVYGVQSDQILLSSIFKTTLLMLFFALALSWVKEMSERLTFSSDQVKITLNPSPNARKSNQLTLTGIKSTPIKINLSISSLILLEKFILKRKYEDPGWLEIKPRMASERKKEYDIQDHNEIKRLLQHLLDAIYGKGNWTKNQHFEPLKDALFEFSEKKQRHIRFKLLPSQLSIM